MLFLRTDSILLKFLLLLFLLKVIFYLIDENVQMHKHKGSSFSRERYGWLKKPEKFPL